MNSIKKININPNDISKISPELILNIILKDGTIIIPDETMPLQDINNLFNNKKEKNKFSNSNISFNYNTNNSYEKEQVKTLETNKRCLYNINKEINKKIENDNINFSNIDKYINKKIEENKNDTFNNNNEKMNYKSQNQSISDLVKEKFHKKFKNNIKEKLPLKATINSEININIKGKETKKSGINNLLKDFNELLSHFNCKKKGIEIEQKDKNKYKYYKKQNLTMKEKLFLENLSEISPNTKSIKYIGRNDDNVTELSEKNLLGINYIKNKMSYLKEKKTLKRNKSNHLYILKDNRFSNIISPPNYLQYKKIKF